MKENANSSHEKKLPEQNEKIVLSKIHKVLEIPTQVKGVEIEGKIIKQVVDSKGNIVIKNLDEAIQETERITNHNLASYADGQEVILETAALSLPVIIIIIYLKEKGVNIPDIIPAFLIALGIAGAFYLKERKSIIKKKIIDKLKNLNQNHQTQVF